MRDSLHEANEIVTRSKARRERGEPKHDFTVPLQRLENRFDTPQPSASLHFYT